MKGRRKIKRAARQLYRLCIVNGQLDEARVRAVATRAAQSGKRGSLGVLAAFQRMVRLDRESHHASIESAAPLAADLRSDLQANLTRLYGAGLETSFTENPALIGGLRVRVGSDVYDGSVRARLAAIDAGL
jgi:F-type H+-transporting ATPase subunit delta